MKKILALTLIAGLGLIGQAQAANYVIDTKGAHAFIQFRIKHLGYSWLHGRFDNFEGSFYYDDKKPEASSVNVSIDTGSLNSNHAERDKHLKGKDFLNVSKYPKATFKSTAFESNGNSTAVLKGELTLHGVTREVAIDVKHIGGGQDPWGGYRQGFTGQTEIALKDFGIDYDLGPASQTVELILDIEGIRQ